jgi:hypothetical protein
VKDDIDTSDGLIKRAVLGDILDDDELEPIPVVGKFIFEERAFGEGANSGAHRVLCF